MILQREHKVFVLDEQAFVDTAVQDAHKKDRDESPASATRATVDTAAKSYPSESP
jgi:hypothetical protein